MYWVSTKRQHSKLQSKVQSYNTAQRADMKWYLFQKQWNKLHTTVNWRLNKKHAFKVKVDPVKWFCQHKYVLFMSKSEILHCQSDSIIELPFLFHCHILWQVWEFWSKHQNIHKYRMSNKENMVKQNHYSSINKEIKSTCQYHFTVLTFATVLTWQFFKTYIMHSSFIHRFVNSWSCDH